MNKKYYLFAAAAAVLSLTACSSDDDAVQANGAKTVAVNQAVDFDVYVPEATDTRAGLEGTMTTGRLQRSEYEGGGFGVYAYLTEDAITTAGDGVNATAYNPASPIAPNFMWNEKILWNATNQGWYYNPLKYWPNETDNDSQSTPAGMEEISGTKSTDRLTFFAYAPYVAAGGGDVEGITTLTDKAGLYGGSGSAVEPTIGYKAALNDPNKAVDLLWGVAPAGGLTYTAVNGRTVSVDEGMPLIDMTKPDVNTNMKFLFNHALARIGVKAVAAIDQVGAGGKLDPNTKITIKEITLTGLFGSTGELNLDNTVPNKANWTKLNGVALSSNPSISTLEAVSAANRTLTLNVGNGTIAEHLRFVGTHGSPAAQTDRVGVTTVKQDVIEPATINNAAGANRNWYTSKDYAAKELIYSETTPYYTDANCTAQPAATVYTDAALTQATDASHFVYTVNSQGVYTESSALVELTYPKVNNYYTLTFKKVVSSVTDAATEIAVGDAAGKTAYTKSTKTYTPKAVGLEPAVDDYVIVGDINKAIAAYPTATTYYKRDANYFMVVPTQNFENSSNITTPADLQALRTVRVKITYYITTEDAALNAERAQTENVIEKDVVFPSLANGKSYNLNLILGLTSVKMEAEVDDWKVINVNADLPQNTAE